MDEIPLVSIACAVYNHEPYIRQCLDGFVMQKTNFKYEAVVHDDASNDNTADIIREYEAKYPDIIKPIYQNINYGLGSAHTGRMKRKAWRGKYLAFCEGDDYWTDPYKLQKQIDIMEANEDIALSHTSFSYLYDKEKVFKEASEESKIVCNMLRGSPKEIQENIIDQNKYRIQPCTAVIRRDQMISLFSSDPLLYSSGYFKASDTSLWVGLCGLGKVHYLNENTSVYRVRSDSASRSTHDSINIKFGMSVAELRLYLLNKYKLSTNMILKYEKEYNKVYYNYLIKSGNSYNPVAPIYFKSRINDVMFKLITYSKTRKMLSVIIKLKKVFI